MVALKLDVFGDKQLSRSMLAFGDRGEDPRPAYEEIADRFRKVQSKQFSTQGRYGSGGWAPLAPSTVAAKASAGHDPRILHATQRLRRSLTTRRHRDHVRVITRDELRLGTSVPYAVHHQHGAPRANLRQRRPVELPDRVRREWVKVLQRWIATGRT